MGNIYKLKTNRVRRTYVGGKLLDIIQCVENPKDSEKPEEWIASIVEANNGASSIKGEGLSVVEDSEVILSSLIDKSSNDMLGSKHCKKYGNSMGVLSKIIDSAERLTIQVHPTKDAAKKFFNSDYGKTECWHILGVREVDGQNPYVYLGFKKGVTKQDWIKNFENQDISAMLDCLHKIQVKVGDTILINGGLPHAIGAGCFLLEIQEPTDLTLRVERVTPSGLKIEDSSCHQGLGFEKMFDIFEYDTYSEEEIRNKYFVNPKITNISQNDKIISLIDKDYTKFFAMEKYQLKNKIEITNQGFSSLTATNGKCKIIEDDVETLLKSGESVFVSNLVEKFTIVPLEDLELIRCFPPNE